MPPPSKRSVFSYDLEHSVSELGRSLDSGGPLEPRLSAVVNGLSLLPAADVPRAERSLGRIASLYGWQRHHDPSLFSRWFGRERADPHVLLQRTAGLEFIFLFHGNGYLREAALKKIDRAPPSAFYFAAIAYRLNDWVGEVRSAAEDCARRTFGKTDARVVAAYLFLICAHSWQRWGAESTILERALSRPDVLPLLVERFKTGNSGPLGTLLRLSMKRPWFDASLRELAMEASLPSVRAVALDALLGGRATWNEGFEWQWIDKSMGLQRRITRIGSREITHADTEAFAALLERGAKDRSPAVRKVAADHIIRNRQHPARIGKALAILRSDNNAAVRTRIEFVDRQSA